MGWRPRYHTQWVQFIDFIVVWNCLILSYCIWQFELQIFQSNFFLFLIDVISQISLISILLFSLIAFIFNLFFNHYGAYSFQRFTSIKKEIFVIVKTCIWGTLFALLLFFMFGIKSIPRMIIFLSVSLITFSLVIEKALLFYLAAKMRKLGKNRKKVIIVGTGLRTTCLIDTIIKNIGWGLDIIGIINEEKVSSSELINGYKILGSICDFEKILNFYNPEEIIITLSSNQFDKIRSVFDICEREGVQVRLNSDFFVYITKNITVDNIYGLKFISFDMVHNSELDGTIKRFFDISFASLAILLSSPLMFVAGIGIMISDGFPIIYNWNVVGLNKRPFKSWKFRTMVKNADALKEKLITKNEMSGPVFKIENDPRIIPFGRWLRKWSVDELPQFFSVLKGDMSVVGPRPSGPHELVKYESWQRRKLSVKPGLTCLWQVNGRNKIRSFDEWVKLDLEYIDNWSLLLDLKIFVKTIIIVLKGTGK